MNQCAFDGFLVSGQKLLPKNAFDFGWADADILIGCNQLRCEECGQMVRSRALTAPTTPGIKHIPEIYDTPDWQKFLESKWLQGHDWGRFYICRCNVVTELDFRHTHDDEAWEMQWRPPWKCAGHPEIELPVELDGVMLADTTRWEDVVDKRFAGEALALDEPEWKDLWLARVYHLLAHTRHAHAISHAVAQRLTDESPRARMEAIDFFRQLPDAPGAERLLELLPRRRELFDGVANPFGPEDLRWYALQVLAKHVKRGSDVALVTARAELLRPGAKPGFLVEAMRRADSAWFDAHKSQF